MKERKWRVSADLHNSTRVLLLRKFQPRLAQVHLRAVTWAYGVPDTFEFNHAAQDCCLIGLHRTEQHEAFTVRLGGATHRPDGTPLFLALSTAAGVPPSTCGQIDFDAVESIEPIYLPMTLKLYPPFNNGNRAVPQAA